jgi:hypothetical protein
MYEGWSGTDDLQLTPPGSDFHPMLFAQLTQELGISSPETSPPLDCLR